MRAITIIIPDTHKIITKDTIKAFKNLDLVEDVILLDNSPFSQDALNQMLYGIKTEYFLMVEENTSLYLDYRVFDKMLGVAKSKSAGITYSDYYEDKDGVKTTHPLIDYQTGSVRDDFDFGKIMLFSTNSVRDAIKKYGGISKVKYAGLYELRLKVSIEHPIYHIKEPLYTVKIAEEIKDEERLFSYVDPKNLTVQKEMELVFTKYLKNINAYIPYERLGHAEESKKSFHVEASIIIPVKNRVLTIADAIKSALNQKTDFSFNIIVVDNHSDDGTEEVVSELSSKYPQVIHMIPERKDLEIGGCWNEAIYSPLCGRYAVQLDSDDLYSSDYVLQKIIDRFRTHRFAMVIGSYKLVDFDLNEIPPGIIDHREWTYENGHNNALRVNGLGAPRAFDTEVLRKVGFSNISYGEDYEVGLSICREYKIGRIFECLYLCRRWKDNTDADLTIEKKNKNNILKDKIRTDEIIKRQKIMKQD